MTTDEIISRLLKNRGLETPEKIEDFFHPKNPADFTASDFGLSQKSIDNAIKLVQSHIRAGHQIAVYGDYDVDGITATAIVWESVYSVYKNIFPHIPHRRDEGYGLSQKGIDHCLQKGAKLIICVDNGIVANEEIVYGQKQGCDFLIIDHHQPDKKLPPANAIIHSTFTSAAGLAWFFVKNLSEEDLREKLSLVSVSVICDLVPLLGINRSFAKYGLEELNQTKRPGLQALFASAGLKNDQLSSYHVGFIIGPRLNAMGRLEHAIDSLRLLCTQNPAQADQLARLLSDTNQTRQDLTQSSTLHALSAVDPQNLPKIILSASPEYDEGVIGLIAGKLVEKFHRPALAVSIGDKSAKGSGRSVPGFDITAYLRKHSKLFTNLGGHSMACGFSLDPEKLDDLQKILLNLSDSQLPPELLIKIQSFDLTVPPSAISYELYARLKDFEPFGLANPRPVFKSENVSVSNFRRLGAHQQHLKFQAGDTEAIYFSAPAGIEAGMTFTDLIYSLDLNDFNNRQTLQLVIKNLTP